MRIDGTSIPSSFFSACIWFYKREYSMHRCMRISIVYETTTQIDTRRVTTTHTTHQPHYTHTNHTTHSPTGVVGV
jgi:hypothetical protein